MTVTKLLINFDHDVSESTIQVLIPYTGSEFGDHGAWSALAPYGARPLGHRQTQ